jgi:hypothetical protein
VDDIDCSIFRTPSSDHELQGVKDMIKLLWPSVIFDDDKATAAVSPHVDSDDEEEIYEKETIDYNELV